MTMIFNSRRPVDYSLQAAHFIHATMTPDSIGGSHELH